MILRRVMKEGSGFESSGFSCEVKLKEIVIPVEIIYNDGAKSVYFECSGAGCVRCDGKSIGVFQDAWSLVRWSNNRTAKLAKVLNYLIEKHGGKESLF